MSQGIGDRSGIDRAVEVAFSQGSRGLGFEPFVREARRLVQRKANPDAHDYKFPVVIFQNYGRAIGLTELIQEDCYGH